MQVAVEGCALSLRLLEERLGAARAVVRVKTIAPGAVPVARKGALEDGHESATLDPGGRRLQQQMQMSGPDGIADVPAVEAESGRRRRIQIARNLLHELDRKRSKRCSSTIDTDIDAWGGLGEDWSWTERDGARDSETWWTTWRRVESDEGPWPTTICLPL